MADWRERLLELLSQDGVTEPPFLSPWRQGLVLALKILGWIILLQVFSAIPVAILAEVLPRPIVAPVCGVVAAGCLALVCWFGMPAFHQLYREALQLRLGLTPTHLLETARRPPVLYLRSFHFDAATAHVQGWVDRLPLTLGVPGAELKLVQVLSSWAPVLAIARPGETDLPFGAARFFVRQDLWQEKLAALVSLCGLVVLATGHSSGLEWEIRHLVANLPPRRLLLWLHIHVGSRTPEARMAEWARFREAHREIFPKPLPEDVASARFICFDDDWTACRLPERPPSLAQRLLVNATANCLRPFLRDRLG